MATITNAQLSIERSGGAASILVSYQPKGSQDDLDNRRTYFETIELYGIDEGSGEDGRNEPIPGAKIEGVIRFPLPRPIVTRHLALPASRLNEDAEGGFGPIRDIFGLNPDEIRARVTLSVAAESNTVVLDQLVNEGFQSRT